MELKKWLTDISRSPEEAAEEYDAIASIYEEKVLSTGYQAPEKVCELVCNLIQSKAIEILDLGCGTGLVGLALSNKGFHNITGIDISSQCLLEAKKKGAYKTLVHGNLLKPLDFSENTFQLVTSSAVFSRFNDNTILEIVKECSRVVSPGGFIIFSHREDWMKDSKIVDLIDALPNLSVRMVTDPLPYYPFDKNFKDLIGVHYLVVEVLSSSQ